MIEDKVINEMIYKDSNKLFNAFIYQIISTINGLNIIVNKTKDLLKKSSSDSIIINNKTVIETRFKHIKNLKDVSKADIYQISKYCMLQNKKEAILIYPEYNKKQRKIYELQTIDNKTYKLKFATINLRRDLKTELEDIKNELVEILGVNDGGI